MGSADLKQTLCNLNGKNEQVLIGFDTSDDAGVFRLSDDLAIVQTLDFITPVVDDPYIYGQIAAANSLSDVFAMGAEVKTALNIVGFDKKNLSKDALGEILRGGFEKIKECGGALLGGHTIESPEMYYGLSVTGTIHPNDVIRNNSAKVGDVLVLTKPLGMGVLTTAIKRDLTDISVIKECAKIMASLNYLPSKIMKKYRINSCTDITGFGLLGHVEAKYNLGIIYYLGEDNLKNSDGKITACNKYMDEKDDIKPSLAVLQADDKEALNWFLKANKEGHSEAKNSINLICDSKPEICKQK